MTLQILTAAPSLYDSNQINHPSQASTSSVESNRSHSPASASTTSAIRDHDVLLGRGGQTNKHIGNKQYRSIVAAHQGEYLQARKKDKVLIARRIVAIVQNKGGRFLKQNSNQQWEPVTDKRAQEKTSQALREGLDVRQKVGTKTKNSPKRNNSNQNGGEERAAKRTKFNPASATASPPVFDNMDNDDGDAATHVTAEETTTPFGPSEASLIMTARPMPLSNYARELSKSDITQECTV